MSKIIKTSPGPVALTYRFTVELHSVGNPDRRQTCGRNVLSPTQRVGCDTIEQCQQVVRAYIDAHDLGGGNWTGGEVREHGAVVGRVSYNGRYWPLEVAIVKPQLAAI